jgi:hypothetical protein
VPDARLGHDAQRALDHAQPGAQDRDQHDLVGQAPALGRLQRRLDRSSRTAQVRERVVEQHHRDVGQRLAEDGRGRRAVAQHREVARGPAGGRRWSRRQAFAGTL